MNKQLISYDTLDAELVKRQNALKYIVLFAAIFISPVALVAFAEPFVLIFVAVLIAIALYILKIYKDMIDAIKTRDFTIYEVRVIDKQMKRGRNQHRSVLYLYFDNGQRVVSPPEEYHATHVGEYFYIIVNNKLKANTSLHILSGIFKHYNTNYYSLSQELVQHVSH